MLAYKSLLYHFIELRIYTLNFLSNKRGSYRSESLPVTEHHPISCCRTRHFPPSTTHMPTPIKYGEEENICGAGKIVDLSMNISGMATHT